MRLFWRIAPKSSGGQCKRSLRDERVGRDEEVEEAKSCDCDGIAIELNGNKQRVRTKVSDAKNDRKFKDIEEKLKISPRNRLFNLLFVRVSILNQM